MVQLAPSSGHVPAIRIADSAALPTRHGDFRIVAFVNEVDGKDHVALIRGDVRGATDVLTRIHSECLTGDAFASLRCDCREQLEESLRLISAAERGIVLYLRQEGRGIGLTNKVRAYALQERGMDTVDANLALGFADDSRQYDAAAGMLDALEVASIQLMTNNPDKLRQLEDFGIEVTRRVPHQVPPNAHNVRYLATKAARSGHLLG